MKRKSPPEAKKQPVASEKGQVRPAPTCLFLYKVRDIGLHHLCTNAACECRWPRDWGRQESGI